MAHNASAAPDIRPPSRHKCLVYEGHPSELLAVVVPFLRRGLEQGRRCLYLGDPQTIRIVEQGLVASGLDLEAAVAGKALTFSSDRSHLDSGAFSPARMVDGLRALVKQAVADGFGGLSATGDMLWEIGSIANLEGLLEYEALLEQAFQELPLFGICQYRRDLLPPRAIRDALLTHRSVDTAATRDHDNLFYLPPELLINAPGQAVRDAQGEWMWRQLDRIMRAERERDAAIAQLRDKQRN